MHIKGETSTVRDRLRLFGKEKFTTMTNFAAALKMKPQALNVYLVGQSLPGNTMQAKLRKMGCDINWLITGERILKESEDKRSRNPFEVDLREVLRYLNSSGRGLDSGKLARKLSMTKQEVDGYLQGEMLIPLPLLIRICEVTNDLSLLNHVFQGRKIVVGWARAGRKRAKG